MKLLLDLGPLVVFLAAYYALGVYEATGLFIGATVLAAAVSYATTGRVSPLMIFSGVFVIILGGLTIFLQNDTFIRMKPTIYYLTVAGLLLGGLALRRLLIKDVMELAVTMEDRGWKVLTWRMGLFFLGMAALNVYVAETYSFETWLWFKIWGFIPITMAFFALQAPLFSRYEIRGEPEPKEAAPSQPQ